MDWKKIQTNFLLLLLIAAAGIFLVQIQTQLQETAVLASFTTEAAESESFRAMYVDGGAMDYIKNTAEKTGVSHMELLASVLFDNGYRLRSADSIKNKPKIGGRLLLKQEKKPEQLKSLSQALEAVWSDLRYFPVPESSINASATVSYVDSWLSPRTYGGERSHEGTDIMADINQRGYYPVVSMTDGVVEKIGWLPKGGYRIGVRGPHGGYFYYAHLASYAKSFQEGEAVEAGQLLGMMGDTGYSEIEGTTGMFDVHLHLGIYIRTKNYEELSVNPYYVLKYMEDRKLTYQF